MAIGNQRIVRTPGIVQNGVRPAANSSPGAEPGFYSGVIDDGALADLWWHRTLQPAEFTAGGGLVHVDIGQEAELLAVHVQAGDEVYLGFRGPCTDQPGSYDAVAPGGGIFRVPLLDGRYVYAYSSAAPSGNVELYAYAGRYARLV